jgi:addiction module HigA family antidote
LRLRVGDQGYGAEQLISRVDFDAGRVDFTALTTGERLPLVHPGDVLRRDFLEPLGLSAHALSLALRVPANRITSILAGKRAVTAETAIRLPRHFGARTAGERIRAEVMPRVVA